MRIDPSIPGQRKSCSHIGGGGGGLFLNEQRERRGSTLHAILQIACLRQQKAESLPRQKRLGSVIEHSISFY